LRSFPRLNSRLITDGCSVKRQKAKGVLCVAGNSARRGVVGKMGYGRHRNAQTPPEIKVRSWREPVVKVVSEVDAFAKPRQRHD